MYGNNQRPSEIIARQRRVIEQQDGIIETLKAALAAAGLSDVPAFAPWMEDLTPQERALVGALYSKYPGSVHKYDLLEVLPSADHVVERQVQLVSVRVHHVRKKLGQDAIENVRGVGYRLSGRLHGELNDLGAPRTEQAVAA